MQPESSINGRIDFRFRPDAHIKQAVLRKRSSHTLHRGDSTDLLGVPGQTDDGLPRKYFLQLPNVLPLHFPPVGQERAFLQCRKQAVDIKAVCLVAVEMQTHKGPFGLLYRHTFRRTYQTDRAYTVVPQKFL